MPKNEDRNAGERGTAARSVELFVVAAVVLLAIVLRFGSLGDKDLGIDEVLHVYAAQSLLDGEGPVLPGGVPYLRALVYTRLVALSGSVFGLNEFSARLPSAVFGVLTILALYLVARHWYSSSAGLAAALVAAVVPSHLVFSGTVRMYTLFHFLYLVLLFLIFEGIEARAPTKLRLPSWFEGLRLRPVYLGFAILLLALAWHVHPLIMPALAGALVYFAIRAWAERGSIAERRKYLALFGLLVLGSLAVSIIQPRIWLRVVSHAAEVPLWAEDFADESGFYLGRLGARYPILFWLCVLSGVAYGLKRRRQITLYLLLGFGVPLGLHSFVLGWKAFRYVSHLTFLLYILFGVGLSAIAEYFCGRLPARGPGRSDKWAGRVFGLVWLLGLGALLGASGWLGQGDEWRGAKASHLDGVWYNNWRAAMGLVAAESVPGRVVITSRPLLAKYYGPDAPIYLLNRLLPSAENRQFSSIAREIGDLEDLVALEAQYSSGWLVFERSVFDSRESIPEDIRSYVVKHWHRNYLPSAPDMVVFRWTTEQGSPKRYTVRLDAIEGGEQYWRNLFGKKYSWWFRRNFDYGDARVAIHFPRVHPKYFEVRLVAEGLKPEYCYQVKLEGKPSALWTYGSDDKANAALGYAGRWWRNAPSPGPSSDEDYEMHRADEDYVFSGFLLMDFFVTDAEGRASVELRADSSFEAIRRTQQRSRRPIDGPVREVHARGVSVGLYGQHQPGRAAPGELLLSAGEYEVQFALTEESFHDPSHARVLVAEEVAFEITGGE